MKLSGKEKCYSSLNKVKGEPKIEVHPSQVRIKNSFDPLQNMNT